MQFVVVCYLLLYPVACDTVTQTHKRHKNPHIPYHIPLERNQLIIHDRLSLVIRYSHIGMTHRPHSHATSVTTEDLTGSEEAGNVAARADSCSAAAFRNERRWQTRSWGRLMNCRRDCGYVRESWSQCGRAQRRRAELIMSFFFFFFFFLQMELFTIRNL